MLLTNEAALLVVRKFAGRVPLPPDVSEADAAQLFSMLVTSRHPDFSDDFTLNAISEVMQVLEHPPEQG